ncbi:hypothetical protein PANT_9c00006 [Moesziomyces antarcticus T-34]|uniref:Uncharacterized protein n=1 Tax=Pseudozyma antarctica (strain T-34) TaxID=1151754 RepID=M9ME75_PSEA3|nr:hypothetical protein PANT_9c00006 [Moesziomyces antarcticus T-34]
MTSLRTSGIDAPLRQQTRSAPRKDSLSSRHADICLGSFLLILLANSDFWINVLLTILGYLPGIIHALYIIFKY